METIKKGTRQHGVTILLQELLCEAGYNISIDGDFGPSTDKAVRDFQKQNGMFIDGVVGTKTWIKFTLMFPEYFQEMTNKFLSQKDIDKVAKDLGVESAAVSAVREVEAGGSGFHGLRPKILFEGHTFWKRLKKYGIEPGQYRQGNENILYPKWTNDVRKYYKEDQYARLDQARNIHEEAALESASWGLFQIMGYHWESLGYASIKNFVSKNYKSENEHLRAFAKFLEINNLVRHLRALDWAKFARGYNGPAYKKNRYDEKLAAAYQRHKT